MEYVMEYYPLLCAIYPGSAGDCAYADITHECCFVSEVGSAWFRECSVLHVIRFFVSDVIGAAGI